MNTPVRTLSSPWYREPWPWLLMLGPFLVIVAGIVTAWLAVRSSDGLVDDDYYKQGLAVNQRIHRDREARERGVRVDVSLTENGRAIVASLHEKLDHGVPPIIRMRLSHPTVAGRDINLVLPIGPDGLYRAVMSEPLSGRWLLSIEDASSQWRLVGEWQPESMPALHLAPKVESFNAGPTHQGG